MIGAKDHYREAQFRPIARKTLREMLITFVRREFPRLGGPWVVDMFVDKMLELVDSYRLHFGQLKPGQVVWPAVAIEDRPAYRKPIWASRLVPVIVTIVNQDDVADLRSDTERYQLRKRAIVRAAHDAFAQGGVLTCTDLGLLFQRSHNQVAAAIRQYEAETGEVVPRRGNVHDMGRTVSHKWAICRKAYLEGQTTPTIARETNHSPEAVDHYILDFARIYFATVQRGMTLEETVFATQRPRYLVKEYICMIDEFGLEEQRISQRAGVSMELSEGQIEPSLAENTEQNEKREQEPIAE